MGVRRRVFEGRERVLVMIFERIIFLDHINHLDNLTGEIPVIK